MYFGYFLILSPWKRAEPFIWTNLIHFHLRMPCAKFGWKWLSGSGEEDEIVKSFDNNDDSTEDDGQRPSAQVS